MQIFQSWIDIVIMFLLLIAYIITYIAQRNVIAAKNETIKANGETIASLKSQIEGLKSLTDSQNSSISTYKEMINIEDLQKHYDWKVEYGVNKEVDRLTKEIITEKNFVAKAAELISHDLYKTVFGSMSFALYVFKKNNSSDEIIKVTVETFFNKNQWIHNIFQEEMTKFRSANPSSGSLPATQTTQP